MQATVPTVQQYSAVDTLYQQKVLQKDSVVEVAL
jgi:hypothetical protein